MKEKRFMTLGVLTFPVLVIFALAISLLAPSSTAQCDSFFESTTQVSSDSCGSVEWDLAVTNQQSYQPWDFGDWWSYGNCTSSYYDCNNDYVPASYLGPGTEEYHDDGAVGDYGEDFHWILDDYLVEGYNSCNNGNPDDEYLSYVNDRYSTGEEEADNSCF